MSEPTVRRYLAVDNETGGFEGTSLLSSYLAVLDADLNITATCSMTLKPDNGVYCVEAGGLAVNKIDLIEHDKTAMTYSAAGATLRHFLKKTSDDGKVKLIPLGHGVVGDMIQLRVLLSRANLEQFTSYRKFDTAVITQFLKFTGHLPENISGSLQSLAAYFCIEPGQAHTAKDDVVTTIAVAKKLRDLVNGYTMKFKAPFTGGETI